MDTKRQLKKRASQINDLLTQTLATAQERLEEYSPSDLNNLAKILLTSSQALENASKEELDVVTSVVEDEQSGTRKRFAAFLEKNTK
jgi:hypothetical protein